MFFRILFLILFLSLNLIARGQDLEEGLHQLNYSRGLFISASEVLSRFKKESPASQFMPKALYLLGTCYLASHQISLAKREFELILSSFGNSDLAPWARLGLGDCYYALENYGRSEEHTSELQSLAYLVCRLLPAKN